MRIPALTAIAAASLASAACFQSTTVLRINGDGSGTIEQTTLVTTAALRQLRQFAAIGHEDGKAPDIFSIEQARQMAAALGPDVTVVSSTPIKTEEGEGSRAILQFHDINRLQVKQTSASDDVVVSRRGTSREAAEVHFALTHQADGHALLRIIMPPPNMAVGMNGAQGSTAPAGSGGKARSRGNLPPEQLAMIKQLFAGMRVAIVIEPQGQLVKTTSPFTDGHRVTLVDVAFDQLFSDDTALSRLQTARSLDDVRSAMKSIPGLKVNLDPEITIEFNPPK
jgi:hypothetical protein